MRCGRTQLFRLQPSVSVHAQLQPLCSAALVPNVLPRRDEGARVSPDDTWAHWILARSGETNFTRIKTSWELDLDSNWYYSSKSTQYNMMIHWQPCICLFALFYCMKTQSARPIYELMTIILLYLKIANIMEADEREAFDDVFPGQIRSILFLTWTQWWNPGSLAFAFSLCFIAWRHNRRGQCNVAVRSLDDVIPRSGRRVVHVDLLTRSKRLCGSWCFWLAIRHYAS